MPGRDTAARVNRELSEIIDLLWLTDELRRERPDPIDEVRNVTFYLEEAARETVPVVLRELAAVFARFGVETIGEVPLRFGTWTGGDRDGNPNVSATVTMQALALQHELGSGSLSDHSRRSLKCSVCHPGVGGVSEELLDSLKEDLERLPEVDDRFRRINAEEPYRLKISCIRAKLACTRARLAAASTIQHQPGADYLGTPELVADLDVLRSSLGEHHGELVADGRVADLIRATRALGLHLATMDIREHAEAHHHAIVALVDRLGEPNPPYAELDRLERGEVAGLRARRPSAPGQSVHAAHRSGGAGRRRVHDDP